MSNYMSQRQKRVHLTENEEATKSKKSCPDPNSNSGENTTDLKPNTTSIQDLPEEILVFIFKKLSFHDIIVNVSRTCPEWKRITAEFFLQSRIRAFANRDEKFMEILKQDGWKEGSNDVELIMTLWENYMTFSNCKSILKVIGIFSIFRFNLEHYF